jgi:superfamily I DNA/RNA helicase
MTRIWSPQQQAVFGWVRTGTGCARIEAVAGSGKTTTLVEATSMMEGTVAFLAYNKNIAVEIGSRTRSNPNVTAGTFHSFGFRAWRRVAYRVKVEDKKLDMICDDLAVPKGLRRFVQRAVSIAKQALIGVDSPAGDMSSWMQLVNHYDLDDLLTDDGSSDASMDSDIDTGLVLAQRVLRESTARDHEIIDFDDMLYAPLVHNARFQTYDWVLVDEAQDTNPARRAMARKLLKTGGRLIAVGDTHQAIYGFTGADSDALDLITREFNCTVLPLTVTYRCPKAVVAHAQQWVSHIEAAPVAPEGEVTMITDVVLDDFAVQGMLRKEDAVLCRNTKPLVELAYSLIKRKVACHVEGRDIGKGLLALAGKWKLRSLDALLTKLDAYEEREVSRLMAKGRESQAASISDRVDTLRVLCNALPPGSTVDDLRAEIDRLFTDTDSGRPADTLTLSTVHKAKGREWERVYLLGRNKYMPSKYARQAWQVQQEINLMYVAVTRAKSVLYEVAVLGGKPAEKAVAA